MSVIGFSFLKEQVRWVLIGGTKAAPVFFGRDRAVYSADLSPSELAVWFKRTLVEILEANNPDKVVARLSWSIRAQSQSYSLIFPCAILEIICADAHIPCVSIGSQALTAKALKFPRGTDVNSECTLRLGSHPPHWDKSQTDAGLAAMFGLD